VSPQQLGDNLNAAMSVNGYDVKHDPDLQALSRAIKSSDAIASVRGRSGLKRALMSAWFGKPADGRLRGLRDEILGSRGGEGKP
jgi:hypothetical protein